MDDILKVEFPVGDLKIVVSEPTPGQQFALSLSRTSSDTDKNRLIKRLIRVLEALTGPEQWYGVIEDALISGEMEPDALVNLGVAVLNFDWAAHRKPVAAPEPVDIEDVAASPAAGPRVVSGG